MGVVGQKPVWSCSSLNSLHVQTLMLTDAPTPVSPKVSNALSFLILPLAVCNMDEICHICTRVHILGVSFINPSVTGVLEHNSERDNMGSALTGSLQILCFLTEGHVRLPSSISLPPLPPSLCLSLSLSPSLSLPPSLSLSLSFSMYHIYIYIYIHTYNT